MFENSCILLLVNNKASLSSGLHFHCLYLMSLSVHGREFVLRAVHSCVSHLTGKGTLKDCSLQKHRTKGKSGREGDTTHWCHGPALQQVQAVSRTLPALWAMLYHAGSLALAWSVLGELLWSFWPSWLLGPVVLQFKALLGIKDWDWVTPTSSDEQLHTSKVFLARVFIWRALQLRFLEFSLAWHPSCVYIIIISSVYSLLF